MAPKNAFLQTLASGPARTRVGAAGLLALALQLRAAWILLGPWVVWSGGVSLARRVRILPAHPDWYLPALVESCVTAAVLVALARRFQAVWAVTIAALAGAAAWALTSTQLPSGLDAYGVVFGLPRELLTTAFLLACVAVSWGRIRPWLAVPVLGLVGGLGAGAIRFLLSNTLLGAPWPEGWPGELATQAIGVALLAVVLALTRRAPRELGGRGQADGPLLAAAGLLLLALLHLAAGARFSGWTRDDSLGLAVAAAILALAVIAALRLSRRSPADAGRDGARTPRG